MKCKLEVALEHPVMFLSDPYYDDTASLEIGDKPIASTDSCIAFRVRPYFEGGANVTISSEKPPSSKKPDYRGTMQFQSGVVSLSDSGRFNYCMFSIDMSQAEIEIWILEDESVWITASGLIEY